MEKEPPAVSVSPTDETLDAFDPQIADTPATTPRRVSLVEGSSGLPMMMTSSIMVTVFVLAVLMCVLSGVAALRKLFQADPADLF